MNKDTMEFQFLDPDARLKAHRDYVDGALPDHLLPEERTMEYFVQACDDNDWRFYEDGTLVDMDE